MGESRESDLRINDKGAIANGINGVVGHLSSLMAKSINRYPRSYMELYSYIFESLDPTESKELLKHWMSAIEGEEPPLFHQEIKNWPPIKDSQGILLYILCENHGRDLPLWKLNAFMENSSLHQQTKRKLQLAIILRKSQSQISSQSSNSSQLTAPDQAGSSKEKTESFEKASPALASSCLTTPISNVLEPAARPWEDSGYFYSFPDSSTLLMCQDWERQIYWTQYSCHTEAFPSFYDQLRPRNPLHSASAAGHTESSLFSVSASVHHKRLFICGVCDKGFKERRKLDDHIRSHTGEKPFHCSYAQCGQAFSINSNRKRHEKRCHSASDNLPGVQAGYVRRENPDSTLSLSLHNPDHTTPVPYSDSAWEVPILHHYTQISTGANTVGALQGFSVPSIDNIYSGFSADPVKARHVFAQVPPFQSI